ncbi:outer dynein arm-docking complex subunit 3 [Lutzomyia longipalpis]|uniref:outer dynein arm-docking complex subunit 3 n=1 Tax=Lutzomyia longipalpis TaxID=7200 RepID=UPI0024845B9E|nr:outer dynein arm-docking complex subunit 3 [Lutzomyia longipalpis]
MSSPQPGKNSEANMAAINKNIVELKKKILLAEGQRKAYRGEWEEEQKSNSEKIADLKKNIKEITVKLKYLKTKKAQRPQNHETIKKLELPPGAANADEAVHVLDLKVIDLKKQTDLIHDQYVKRQKYFDQLVEEYQRLYVSKNKMPSENSVPASETVEEDHNRRLICHLENEIHRTSVQWMEAEHIRKKYRSIKASLMNDAENFESNLLELEQAITEQQIEIDKLHAVNEEALQMRDSTKLVLQKQEQSAASSNRAREKQAQDFRRQVDERKMELERLERRIFATGKTLVHQESAGSGSGDAATGKGHHDTDPSAHAKESTNVMDIAFRKLMESTGATATNEVLGRFLAQREATTRLAYLRNVTETAKKDLENQRDTLSSQLDEFRFADIKENEVNQEEVEKLKTQIAEQNSREIACDSVSEHTRKVSGSIKEALFELLMKIRDMDEISEQNIWHRATENIEDFDLLTAASIPSDLLLKVLQESLRLVMKVHGGREIDREAVEERAESEKSFEDLSIALHSPLPPEEKERPAAFPACYTNLFANRGTGGQTTSISPGQATQAITSDDEGDVPSRHYLKRQAQLIIDSKSRRKGFRVQLPRRK